MSLYYHIYAHILHTSAHCLVSAWNASGMGAGAHALLPVCSTDKEAKRKASKKEKMCQCLIRFAPEVRETQSNLRQH